MRKKADAGLVLMIGVILVAQVFAGYLLMLAGEPRSVWFFCDVLRLCNG